MMAYGNDFVLALIHDGFPVREINGIVHLPFNAEYKIRLKNKDSNLRATARVWIDGRKVSNLGDFILQTGQTLDLERFLDQSMATGNKFQFVPLSDGRVNDPTASENGIIKVEFFREKKADINLNWSWKTTFTKGGWDDKKDSFGNPTYTRDLFETSYNSNNDLIASSNVFSSKTYCVNSVQPCSAPGATVEGSISNQKFSIGDFFETEIIPIVLTIQVKGINTFSPPPEIKPNSQNKERFCGGCGKRRNKMSDRFCSRCGNKYNTFR